MTDIAKLKEAAEKATPGPWGASKTAFHKLPDAKNYVAISGGGLSICKMTGSEGMQAADVPDAQFIALANPSTILSLIARMEALEEALTRIAKRATHDAEDTDADRKRDLYHILAIAEAALAISETQVEK